MEINQAWSEEFFGAMSEDLVLKRRETHTIEFKAIFDWPNKEFKSNIGKTAAAFANRDGGLIIFGIENNPHTLVGVNNFYQIDDACISAYLNEVFSPSIVFARQSFQVSGKQVGMIQIFESKNKPVICIKDSAKTFDSDVYYRYSAMSSKIKSGDLLYLMQEVRERDKNKWIDLLSNIAHVGVDNVALLNSISGELTSANNNTFLIDESILNQIKVLDRYSESEVGAPAVRIIGNVVNAATVIEKPKNIFEEDIFLAFLTGKLMSGGMEYVSAILRMNSEIYPIYLFLNSAMVEETKRAESIELISTRCKNKTKVLARLIDDSKLEAKKNQYSLISPKWGEVRKKYYDAFVNNETIDVKTEADCKSALESIFSLEKDGFDVTFVKSQLHIIFQGFYPFKKGGINHVFRWASAYLDNISYS